MTILGVDPGLANSGYAVIDGGVILRLGLLRSKPTKQVTLRIREHAGLTWNIAQGMTMAIETPTFPRSARPAALLFASFSCWVASAGEVCGMTTKEWRARLGLVPRKTTEERKEDTRAAMSARWPTADVEMTVRKVPPSLREHVWDALAIATAWQLGPRS